MRVQNHRITEKPPQQEIEQAKRNLEDFIERSRDPKTGKEYIDSLLTWDDFEKTLNLTEEELNKINTEIKKAGKRIDFREKRDKRRIFIPAKNKEA